MRLILAQYRGHQRGNRQAGHGQGHKAMAVGTKIAVGHLQRLLMGVAVRIDVTGSMPGQEQLGTQ